MIYVRLAGGLGNQLFQLAAALYLQAKTNMSISFYTNHLKNYDTPREFMLQELIENEIDFSFSQPNLFCTIILKYRLNKLLPFCFQWSITRKNINNYKKSSFYVLDDYFLEINSYPNIINLLSEIIAQKSKKNSRINSIINELSNEKDLIGLHFRRGDYLSKKYSKILYSQTNDYYVNAINQLKSNSSSLIFFSEDIYEDLTTISSLKKYYSKKFNLTDVEEFLLLSRCKKMIIANSTFSFWAALIAGINVKNSIVIAPVNWEYNNNNNSIWLKNLNSYHFFRLLN